MFQRGDFVIFRPSFSVNGQEKEFGCLTVGIILDTSQGISVLEGLQATEKRQHLLSIRIAGEYCDGQDYPDKLDETNCQCNHLCSCCWHIRRRETLVAKLNNADLQADTDIGVVAKPRSSGISDLDILFASQQLLTDNNSLYRLDMFCKIIANSNVYRPSIFHSKIKKAKGTIMINHNLTIKLYTFTTWKHNLSHYQKMKADATVLIQKHTRRFFERDTIEKQKIWMKWWNLQKKFWHFYVDPKDGLDCCYNVTGTNVYFDTKLLADQWHEAMRNAISTIAFHAGKSISFRLNEAMRKWKLALTLQKQEMEIMLHEDFLSSTSISHN